MTPSQLLQRIPEAAPPIVIEGQNFDRQQLEVVPCAGAHYTSEAMEEDFSTAVELLMTTPTFLEFLRDVDDKYNDILSEKAREALDSHLATIEEFTGQWINRD